METSQLEQMVRWLDEERKRDRAQITALQERLEQQAQLIQGQSKELDGLRKELVSAQTDLRRTDDYPSMIETTQRDLGGQVDALKAQIRRERLESDQNRRAEIELLNDMIADLEKRIRPTLRYEEQLEARAAGEQRLQGQMQTLSSSVSDFTRRTDDRLQSIVYLEEQRRADTRRVGEVEGELPGLRQRADELAARMIRLEDSIRKLPAQVDEAVEIAQSYEPRIEELRVSDFQREQRVKKYMEQAAQVNEEVQRLVEQTQRYALLYNQNRQALDGLTAFEERLERRQSETAEMQRLTEERLLRQWDEWQEAFARDWQKRVVDEEDRWRRQDLGNQRTLEHLTEVDEELELHYVNLLALWEEIRARVDRLVRVYRDIAGEGSESPDSHLKELRRFGEDKHRQLM